VEPLLAALRVGQPLPLRELRIPSGDRRLPARLVPPPPTRPAFFAHPRLRRASGISQFALSAALEALQSWPSSATDTTRLGIVTGTHGASIRYSERFYGEVLQNPATASPLLFPETVINAPASHAAAFLGCAGLCYSLIADQTAFVQALLVGCHWLLDDRVDGCLVLGLDEAAWPLADALGHFARGLPLGEGAGALLLAREPGAGPRVELERITEAHLYAGATTKEPAARAMRAELPAEAPRELLVDSRCGAARVDRAETTAWADWQGARASPRQVLGEALSAATAWQFVAARAAVADGSATAANLSVVGGNLQAIGARLV
jgi:3-oxoacyl-(acyl-carrier-protein) synthase